MINRIYEDLLKKIRMNNLRIIFMGTPEFAVPSLEKLLEAGYEIVAVITAPDKPAGRGLQAKRKCCKKICIVKRAKNFTTGKIKKS